MEHSEKMVEILRLIEQIPEPERSKILCECLVELWGKFKTLEDDTRNKTCDLVEMLRKLGNQLRDCEQLKKHISEQEAAVSKLVMKVQDIENVSYDSSVFIEIPNYRQKKAAAMTGTPSFYSDDFYTEHHGYRMCARVYLNGHGIGKGTHLSIFFAIKKGRYDNFLSWPFQHRVTFALLNQDNKPPLRYTLKPDPISPSFQKPLEEMNISSGFPMFVAHSVIENPEKGFLRNNTIAIEVVVDVPDH